MRACHCNVITAAAFQKTIHDNPETIASAPDLLSAVGFVHRETLRIEDKTPKPYSCTTCFNLVAEYVQDAGYFENEIIPERTLCAACPRRACLFIPV